MPYLILAYTLLFTTVASKHFRLAIGWFIITLPAYLIRTSFGPLPTTLLELQFIALFGVWLLRYGKTDLPELLVLARRYRFLTVASAALLLTSLIAAGTGVAFMPALGIWRAYFLEPFLLFLILIARRADIQPRFIVSSLLLSTASIVIYAVIQQITGFGIATAEWTAASTRRVTAFFSSPNAVGLYVAPIFMLLLGRLTGPLSKPNTLRKKIVYSAYWLLFSLSIPALAFTKSMGTFIGLMAACAVFIYLLGYRRLVLVGTLIALVIALMPQSKLLLASKQRSGGNRLLLWSYSWEYLTSSPRNFIFGAGLRSFYPRIQQPRFNPKTLEPLIYPHNIFLNFWTEIGLVGMLSFIGVYTALIRVSYALYKKSRLIGAAILAILTLIVLHGLIDVPYFKNDLAMLFWIFAALIINWSEQAQTLPRT